MTKEISKQSFRSEIIESTMLVLVQFGTRWSGACQIIEPIFNDLAKSYNGMVKFFTVDTENEKELANEHGVMEIPTILFFRCGVVIDHTVGLVPKNVLISKIELAMMTGSIANY